MSRDAAGLLSVDNQKAESVRTEQVSMHTYEKIETPELKRGRKNQHLRISEASHDFEVCEQGPKNQHQPEITGNKCTVKK